MTRGGMMASLCFPSLFFPFARRIPNFCLELSASKTRCMDSLPEIYPLTSLQIGDIQSSQSLAFLFFAHSSKRILILVDNRPWSSNPPISTQLWQLIVTKYRVSPFINSKSFDFDEDSDCSRNDPLALSSSGKLQKRWYSVIDAAEWQKRLSKTLHGFIVFEVAWKDVQGVNYANELQTDTSLALEVKFMRKWEFNDVEEAMRQTHSWFSGMAYECQSLESNLRKLSGLNLSDVIAVTSSKDAYFRGFSLFEDLPDDKLFHDADEHGPPSSMTDGTRNVPVVFVDKLLLLRFSDCVLPFKLKKVLTSDLRLLRKLESGLPSWVVFLQSYPLLCHLYRPWMKQLARAVYLLISLSTFLVAFYDLYKNVPLLKAAVAGLCGPFSGWMERWDVLSRVRYLGTMLLLQNFEKAAGWLVEAARATRPMVVVVTKPLVGPLTSVVELLSPQWSACARAGEMLASTLALATESVYEMYLGFTGILLCPFGFLSAGIWGVVASAYTILRSMAELSLVPIRCVFALVGYVASSVLPSAFVLAKDLWRVVGAVLPPLAHASVATGGASSMSSVSRGLWNDLLKQIFWAAQGIVNGFLAFFVVCNKHRLRYSSSS